MTPRGTADDPLMDLHTASAYALPSQEWALATQQGSLVVFVATDAWSQRVPEAFALLDVVERGRVQRKQRRDDRDITTLAYACHRLVLSAVLGCPPGEVSLGRDTLGCPRLADDRVRTSLSHADGLVAIAVSCVGRVGIDIEPVARAGAMAEIATRVCHPRELVALSRLSGSERTRALLSLWVCKEALLKAAGIGLAVDMEQFEAPVDRTLPLPGGVPGTAIVRLFDGDDRFLAALAGPPGGITSAWLPPPT